MAVSIHEQVGESAATTTPAHRAAPSSTSFISNSLIMFGGQIAIKLISFLFSIIIIRHLGNEEYGKYAVCVAFGSLFAVLSDLGLGQLAVKRFARDRSPSLIATLASNIVGLRIVLALGVVALTAIAAWIAGYSGELRFGIFVGALGLISYAFFGLADALALGLERFRASATLNVGVQLTTLAVAALFIFNGGGFLGLLAASTVAVITVALIGLRRFSRETPLRAPLAPGSWPGLIRSALPFAGITLALSVSYKADTVILSFAVPVSVIGAYTVAYNLVFTCITLSHSINLALFPAMTREYAAAPESAAQLFRQGLRVLLFVSLPAAVFLSLNAEAIIHLLYGEHFAEAALPLSILGWAIPLMFLSEFLGYVAIVVDRETLAARANWVSAAGNVAANLALIPIFGVLAAATITVLTELLLVGQYAISLRRYRLLAGVGRQVAGTILATAVFGGVILLLRGQGWPVILLAVVVGTIYLLASRVLGAVGRDEVALIGKFFQRRSRTA